MVLQTRGTTYTTSSSILYLKVHTLILVPGLFLLIIGVASFAIFMLPKFNQIQSDEE